MRDDDIYATLLALSDDDEDIDFSIQMAETNGDISLGSILAYYLDDENEDDGE